MRIASLVLSVSFAAVLIVLSSQTVRAQDSASQSPTSKDGTVYERGAHGVTPPKGLYMPQPDYSDKARKKKIQGVVTLSVVVTPEGTARDIQVTKSLEPSLDQKAVESVSKWKFTPATKDGQPVAIKVVIEVSFHLY